MNNTQVYLLNCGFLDDEELSKKALFHTSKDRQERIIKHNIKSNKKTIIGTDILLKYILKINNINSVLKHNEDGKPYLENSNIFVSISHSHDYCLIGISAEKIGLDIEKINGLRQNILKRCYSEEEKEYVLNSTDQTKAFYEIWSRKESFIKANHFMDFKSFSTLVPEESMKYNSYDVDGYSCVTYTSSNYINLFREINKDTIIEFIESL